MEPLAQIVHEEVQKYAGSGRGGNVRLFATLDDDHQTYAVMRSAIRVRLKVVVRAWWYWRGL